MTKKGSDPKLEAEAQAFVQRFMKTYDRAAVTGKFDAVGAMYTAECYGCKNYVSGLQKVYQGGSQDRGGAPRRTPLHHGRRIGQPRDPQVKSTISVVQDHQFIGKHRRQ